MALDAPLRVQLGNALGATLAVALQPEAHYRVNPD